MGRCQSTPGLVETKGKTPIEEMWLCQPAHTALTYYNPQSVFRYMRFVIFIVIIMYNTLSLFDVWFIYVYSRAPSPKSTRGELVVERPKVSESPGSISPSVNSSDERPRSRTTSHASRPQSQPSRTGIINIKMFKLTDKQYYWPQNCRAFNSYC